MCLAITCHLHFWRDDRDLLRATAVTRGWNGYRNKSAEKVDPGEENSPAAPAGTRTGDLSITSPALQPLICLCATDLALTGSEGEDGRDQGLPLTDHSLEVMGVARASLNCPLT